MGATVRPNADSPTMTPYAERLIEILRYVLALQPGEQADLRIPGKDLLLSSQESASLPGIGSSNNETWLKIGKLDIGMPPSQVDDQGQPLPGSGHALFLWQQSQQPKEATNRIHAKLVAAYRDLKLDGGAETMEVVCGLGMLTGRTSGGQELYAPLILQACELLLHDDLATTVEIQPAAALPSLNTPLVKRLWPDRLPGLEAMMAEIAESENFVAPHDHSLAQPLYDAVSNWGVKVVPEWCFFMRRRPSNRINKDIAALIAHIEAGAELPEGLLELVDRDYNPEMVGELPSYRGLEHVGKTIADKPEDLYFPLPYNDEQVDIIQRLDTSNGVVVQGPPGTGKSHTIANIICHYLAKGKTVLVSSGSAGALDVIRGKLPEEIRDLSASLLSSDSESLKEFEMSISTIVSKVAGLDPGRTQENLDAALAKTDELHREIDAVDARMDALASRHLSLHEIAGEQMNAAEVARLARTQSHHPHINEGVANVRKDTVQALVDKIAKQRQALGSLLGDPEMMDYPTYLDFPAGTIRQWGTHVERVHELGAMPERKWYAALNTHDLVGLAAWVRDACRQMADLESSAWWKEEWQSRFRADVIAMGPSDPLRRTIDTVLADTLSHYSRVRELDGRVSLDYSLMGNPEILAGARVAIENLSEGRRAFPLLAIGKQEEKRLLDSVLVDGEEATTAEQWKMVGRRIQDLVGISPILRRWNALAEAAGWPAINTKRLGSARSLIEARNMAEQAAGILRHIDMEAQGNAKLGTAWRNGREDVARALDREIEYRQVRLSIQEHQQDLEAKLGHFAFGRRVLDDMRQIQDHPDAAAHAQDLCNEAIFKNDRMSGAHDTLMELRATANGLAGLGAHIWAQSLVSIPIDPSGQDPVIRDDWWESWKIQVARQVAKAFGDPGDVARLLDERRALSNELAREYRNIIAETAWLKMAENATPRVRQALQKYLGAVRKIGQGTGMRAARHRAVAKEAMEEAHRAIPCWIMPQGRVSESMPPEIGLFDLVIMDEASQSGIDAIMTLMRGKKILIVGDDRQVSPSGVGKDERTIIENRDTLLVKQPYAHRMLPDQSIYDLFSEVFAGSTIMLKEHFRSSEAIIEYSNREYYGGQIIPLRVPEMHKRIDPPLVDVVLMDGKKEGDINSREADFIAEEIERISQSGMMEGRTVGVVTLTSNDKQAMEIKRRISERISDVRYTSMGISVGPPAQFQGKERDIMFVSMVWDANSRDPGNRVDFQQRFNVALSRARDRMYLVRSIPDGYAKPDNLLDRVIRHFQDPFVGEDGVSQDNVLERCETWFEKEIGKFLLDRGYRVLAKVGRKGYRIDLVVEGELGRRIAIECDGDRRWSDGQWRDAQRRQRVLERAGWKFWRCFQAHYELDKENAINSLLAALAEQQITPIGNAESKRWVERRVLGQVDEPVRMEHVAPWTGSFDELSKKCDSPFEADILKYLLDAGYRAEPQHEVRGYKIDILVQDRAGRKLAVECDGDQFHSLEHQEDDQKRQAFLETTEGLVFWRVFYSDFMRSKARSLNSLQEALDDAGIDPWPKVS